MAQSWTSTPSSAALDAVRDDPVLFAQARIENGTVVWPNGADLCPDVLIWGGMPPA